MNTRSLLSGPPSVVNIGLRGFAEDLAARKVWFTTPGAICAHVAAA